MTTNINEPPSRLRFTSLMYAKEVGQDFLGLYNPIYGHNFLFIRKDFFEKLKRGPLVYHSSLERLIEKRFILPSYFSEESYLTSFKERFNLEVHLMYLLISQGCNLNCGYCFERGMASSANMPLSIASSSLESFFRISSPERKIIFYGGEPFMNREVFFDTVSMVRENYGPLGLETKVNVVTNGTLIDEKTALFVKKNNIDISVSIDGPEFIHDAVRKNRNGRGSFKEALRGYSILREVGVPVSISCTISKTNVDYLEEIAYFFAEELHPFSVGFNLLIGGESSGLKIEKATENLLKAYTILRDRGIYEDRIMRRLECATKGRFYLKECAAYGNQMVVRWDGKVGPCHAFCTSDKYFVGDIREKNFNLPKELFEKWARRGPLFNKSCLSCPFVLLCGGGCAFNAEQIGGDIGEIDINTCIHTRKLVDWIIEQLWKQKS